MNGLLLWLLTTVIFFIGDALWLSFVLKPYFIPRIAHLMQVTADGYAVNYVVAFIAYIILTIGLYWLVVAPCIAASYGAIFFNGALFGFCLYGVYDCTNYAILNNWSLLFSSIDVLWGTVWCGMTSAITIFLVNYFKL